MLLRSTLFTATAAALAACAGTPATATPTPAAPPSTGSVTFAAGAAAEVAVRRAPTGHLLVRPRIGGRDAGTFLLDTGAAICCVTPAVAAELHLQAAGDTTAVGTGGSAPATLWRVPELELGPMRVRDLTCLGIDLGFLEPHVGEPVAGILGHGFLATCVVELDLATPRVALHDAATFALGAGTWHELDLAGGTPTVRADCEGNPGRFQIDTGQDTAVVVHRAAVARWQLAVGRDLRPAAVRGVGGDVPAQAGTLRTFTLAGATSNDVPVLLLQADTGSRSGARRDGAIGAGLLRSFVLVLDYCRSRAAFLQHR
jgi:predicted aspartyl protease